MTFLAKLDAMTQGGPVDFTRLLEYQRFVHDHADALAELVRAAERMAEVQDEPCRWDHNGYCQAHYLDHPLDGCRVAMFKAALAALDREQK